MNEVFQRVLPQSDGEVTDFDAKIFAMKGEVCSKIDPACGETTPEQAYDEIFSGGSKRCQACRTMVADADELLWRESRKR